VRVIGEIAPTLSAQFAAPDVESGGCWKLDALCADLDVQIGLSVVSRTHRDRRHLRLRGVARRRVHGARWPLQCQRERRRRVAAERPRRRSGGLAAASATSGVVFVLGVPRLPDPVRSFDRMKLAAKRMARTLGGELVDDFQRPLDVRRSPRSARVGARRRLKTATSEPGSARWRCSRRSDDPHAHCVHAAPGGANLAGGGPAGGWSADG
jgi:hypothetical protein